MSEAQLWAILTPVLTAALASGVTYLGYIVTKLFNIHIARIQHEELRKRIYDLVLAAEKKGGSSEDKFKYVKANAMVFVESLGLTLTENQVEALIEAAVKIMDLQEAATVTTVTTTPAAGTTTTQATVTTTAAPELDGIALTVGPVR